MHLKIFFLDHRVPVVLHFSEYATNKGELDVLAENGYCVQTYAAGSWSHVIRIKDDKDESWPDPPMPTAEGIVFENEEDEESLGLEPIQEIGSRLQNDPRLAR